MVALQLSFHRTVYNSGPDANPEKLPFPQGFGCPFLLVAGHPACFCLQPVLSKYTHWLSTSASTAAAHALTIVAQEDQYGGIRLDFCVRGYTNWESLISFPTGRILFQSPCPSKKASLCLTLTGTKYLGAGLLHHTALHLPQMWSCWKHILNGYQNS